VAAIVILLSVIDPSVHLCGIPDNGTNLCTQLFDPLQCLLRKCIMLDLELLILIPQVVHQLCIKSKSVDSLDWELKRLYHLHTTKQLHFCH